MHGRVIIDSAPPLRSSSLGSVFLPHLVGFSLVQLLVLYDNQRLIPFL